MDTSNTALYQYVLRQGDTPLILAQRLCEWCGHAPELEIDLALANIGLDLLGQARHFLSYAATVSGDPSSNEDKLAYLRDEPQYYNLLLAEQPNGGFNHTLARQFFLDAYHLLLHQQLRHSTDSTLAAIAAKSLKEAQYHLRFSQSWLIRLGDGTEESQQKMQQAVDELWRFTGELFQADAIETTLAERGIAVHPADLQAPWQEIIDETFSKARLLVPQTRAFRSGGKQGRHSEHLGYLLAELQFIQRAYPHCEW